MIEQKIRQSLVVDRVIPEYVRDEFPRFVEFIRAYYRWLDSDGNTNDMLAKFLANKDVQTVSSDDHAFFILNTFLSSIPKTLDVDYKLLVQNIKSFYSEKGTEDSIKAFFYLLSESRKPNSIVIEFVGYEDLLIGLDAYGINSGAKATILNAVRVSPSSTYVTLTVQYSTEPAYKGRFFTSVDEIQIGDQQYPIAVEDFNVNVFYPKDYILRASDGEYSREYRCRIKFPAGEYVDYTNKSFESSSGSIGRVQRQSSTVGSRSGFDYYELVLNFTKPTVWALDEILHIGDSVIHPVPLFTGVEVIDGGLQYQPGDTFNITDGSELLGTVTIKTTCKCRVKYYTINNGGTGYQLYERFSLRYSDGLYGTGYVSEVNAGVISKIHLEFTRDLSDEYPIIEFDSGNQTADIYLYGDFIGAVKTAIVDDVGFDVGIDAYVDIPNKPFPLRTANLQLARGTLYRTRLDPKSERGTLSSYYRLQDNFYWQDYSYVLQFNRSFNFNEHFDLFKKTVHPAGTKAFFEYRRAGSGAPDLVARIGWREKFSKIQQEKISSKTIGDVAYEAIEGYERIKDLTPLLTNVFPGYFRENNKIATLDDHLYFPYVGMTIAELDNNVTLHKYTCTIDVHPLYVQIIT